MTNQIVDDALALIRLMSEEEKMRLLTQLSDRAATYEDVSNYIFALFRTIPRMDVCVDIYTKMKKSIADDLAIVDGLDIPDI